MMETSRLALVAILTDCVSIIEENKWEVPGRWRVPFTRVEHDGKRYVNFHQSDVLPRYLTSRLTNAMIHDACTVVNKHQLKYDPRTLWFYFQLIG